MDLENVCIWIYSSLQQKQIFHKFKKIEIDILYIDLNKPCFVGPEPKYQIKGMSSWSLVEKWHRPSIDMCYVGEDPLDNAVDIQQVKSNGFFATACKKSNGIFLQQHFVKNQMAYFCNNIGWIQVVTVDKWDARPIKVIIVPHSHQDPGWLFTFQHYYNIYTKSTLDNMVDKLSGHPQWRFIWSEVIFLSKWWSEASIVQKQKFKRGQLEIVTGGWVMTDEGTAHYVAMLDQLIEGHQWLKHNLGIIPNISWSVDPFGHSPTMAYLLKKSDQRAMIIQRIHYAIKRHFAKEKNFEFRWRQIWANKCFRGKKTVDIVEINDENVEKISWSLWEQFQKKASLYRSDTILVPHGDDFRYQNEEEWDKQLLNMEKLMKYINNNPAMKTQVKFGTLTEYINEVTSKIEMDKFPSFTGDFFTYNDRDDQYWSGYFTSRPHYKYMARKLQDLLRSVEILFTLNLAQALKHKRLKLIETIFRYKPDLVTARQNLGLIQHHDAITGTARPDAVNDYGNRKIIFYNSLGHRRQEVVHLHLSFEIEIPPVAIVTYLIESVDINKMQRNSMSNILLIRDKKQMEEDFRSLEFRITEGDNLPSFRISNPHMIATFYTCNGKLQMLPELNSSIYVISGPVYSKVVTVHPYVLHEVVLYNVTDVKKLYYLSENFKMHRKKYRKKFTIQGNFYPMTSMAAIESESERLTLLTLGTHAVKVIPNRSFTDVKIEEVAETTITGVKVKKILNKMNRLIILPMEMNTYKLTFR
ncbi:hypothetical protein KUTeg_013692 [Tegillarca granosa]|uniref:Glycoside hydrolase family 38 central domain-containing protein n=1 Tax=Tegillarca granosa TaxID=220873 RepID=A0ABQ9EZU4_TEGGR|nr:hypothetical protein KUTeg_013692 [Tegillarca granosa]